MTTATKKAPPLPYYHEIRQQVPHEVKDDCGMCFDVERTANGALSAKVRACGRVIIDGVAYKYDRDIRVALKRAK